VTSSEFARQHEIVAETAMVLTSDPGRPLVQGVMSYHTSQPFGVLLSLRLGDAPAVDWTFARELLIQCVQLPAGYGDIQLYPVFEGIIIELHSPDGDAQLLADTTAMQDFADAIEAAVPVGQESEFYSLDAELVTLLAMATERPTNN
jgi:hypothetical protein